MHWKIKNIHVTQFIVISTLLLESETKLQYLHGMPIYKNNIYTPVRDLKKPLKSQYILLSISSRYLYSYYI